MIRGELDFHLRSEPNLIIDAGANIGLASIVFAQRYPGARIVALEVDASNVVVLRKNVEAYRNVQVRHAALWPDDGFVRIVNPEADPYAFRVGECSSDDPGAVPCVSPTTADGQSLAYRKRRLTCWNCCIGD